MRQVLSLVILATLFGCAASSEPTAPSAPTLVAAATPAAAASAAAPKQICSRETPVGSNRPVTVCHDVDGVNGQDNQRTADDLSRQIGLTTQMIGRAGH